MVGLTLIRDCFGFAGSIRRASRRAARRESRAPIQTDQRITPLARETHGTTAPTEVSAHA